jgi:hypothetical protein
MSTERPKLRVIHGGNSNIPNSPENISTMEEIDEEIRAELRQHYLLLIESLQPELTQNVNVDEVKEHMSEFAKLSNQNLHSLIVNYLIDPSRSLESKSRFIAFMIEVQNRVDQDGNFTHLLSEQSKSNQQHEG